MIVKTEEDPLKEADIMVENFVDHVIMEVWDNKEHFVPLLFQIQSVFKAPLVHILTKYWPSGPKYFLCLWIFLNWAYSVGQI